MYYEKLYLREIAVKNQIICLNDYMNDVSTNFYLNFLMIIALKNKKEFLVN